MIKFFVVPVFLFCGFVSLDVLAADSDDAGALIYDVYAGGIHAVEAELSINFEKKNQYSIALEAITRGFLGRVAPWNGVFESHGWVEKNGDYRPKLHRSTATWKDEEEIKSYHYGRDKSFKGLEIKDHDKDLEKKVVDDELTQGTTDALTATLSVMRNVAAGEECAGDEEVFDGKRRFRQVFQSEGMEVLKASRYNIYEGEAAVCTVEVIPVGGTWYEKPRGWMSIQEQGRDRGTMPTVWMGVIEGYDVAIPVKVRVKTAYGTLFMHLSEYQVGSEVFQVAKRRD